MYITLHYKPTTIIPPAKFKVLDIKSKYSRRSKVYLPQKYIPYIAIHYTKIKMKNKLTRLNSQ